MILDVVTIVMYTKGNLPAMGRGWVIISDELR